MYYTQIYYESIDAAITTISDCFNQKDYNTYAKLEQVLLLAASKSSHASELEGVLVFYQDNFDKSMLETQLEVFSHMDIKPAGETLTIRDVHKHIKSLSPSQ